MVYGSYYERKPSVSYLWKNIHIRCSIYIKNSENVVDFLHQTPDRGLRLHVSSIVWISLVGRLFITSTLNLILRNVNRRWSLTKELWMFYPRSTSDEGPKVTECTRLIRETRLFRREDESDPDPKCKETEDSIHLYHKVKCCFWKLDLT